MISVPHQDTMRRYWIASIQDAKDGFICILYNTNKDFLLLHRKERREKLRQASCRNTTPHKDVITAR